MGFWRDIGAALDLCHEHPKEEREKAAREYAYRITGHGGGCSCHWCKCAELGADKQR